MNWSTIKEKVLEAVIHALVFGMGIVILYAISVVLVGDVKLKKEHDDTVARESEIIARLNVLEDVVLAGKVVVTNKPVTISGLFNTNRPPVTMSPAPTISPDPHNVIESLRNAQQVQKQYKQDYTK